ncbi:nucleoside phosphorylase domain-containing protein [Hypoxylon trugodes]|uniref:nucleoside phosphorylase domain-containing protein n=1 Tax=Hypoxylon trugodes TaxID=326681 RepID=UPI0021958750|nr:nucleoside phosphorylase domain-containing protein [Hypoxylon trugodes]KAI1387823.1 nucleoside phosphorylase domain-containing protein [Hypoxylon trugodes]
MSEQLIMNPHRTLAISTDSILSCSPTSRNGFHIAIVCALPIEADAIIAAFGIYWEDHGLLYDKAYGDPNAYSTGVIGRHNVVVAHMPSMGKASAASVAVNLRLSFPKIELVLVAGTCGCSPKTSEGDEIILGDVIISTGVVQYDLGHRMPEGFKSKKKILDSLGRPNTELRSIVNKIQGIRGRKKLRNNIAECLAQFQGVPELEAEYPGIEEDRLFQAEYCHRIDGKSCKECGCDGEKLIPRVRLNTNHQVVEHFGLIASGDTVLMSGRDRDILTQEENVIGFEMEGAGVWDNYPCVVIKGACDYADSHKNEKWRRYAAATSAACVKAFLNSWVPGNSESRILSGPEVGPSSAVIFDGNQEILHQRSQPRFTNTPQEILEPNNTLRDPEIFGEMKHVKGLKLIR